MGKVIRREVDEETLLRVAGNAYPEGLPDTYKQALERLRAGGNGDTLSLFVVLELCESSQIDGTGVGDKPARYDLDAAIEAIVTAISELDGVVDALEALGRTEPLKGPGGELIWLPE